MNYRRGADGSANPRLSFPFAGMDFELVLDQWEDERYYTDDVNSWERVPESLVQQIILGGARIICERGSKDGLWRDAEGWPVMIGTSSPSLWVPSAPETTWSPADPLAYTDDPPRLPAAAAAEPSASVVDLLVPRAPGSEPAFAQAREDLSEMAARVEAGLTTLGQTMRLPSAGVAWLVARDGREIFVELRFAHEVTQDVLEFAVLGTGDLHHDILVEYRSIVGRWMGRALWPVFGGNDLRGMLRVAERELNQVDRQGPPAHLTIDLGPAA